MPLTAAAEKQIISMIFREIRLEIFCEHQALFILSRKVTQFEKLILSAANSRWQFIVEAVPINTAMVYFTIFSQPRKN